MCPVPYEYTCPLVELAVTIDECEQILATLQTGRETGNVPQNYVQKTLQKSCDSNGLKLAIELVSNRSLIRESSRKLRVPYSTLPEHINADVFHNCAGRPSKFTDDEELCLKQATFALQV